MSEPHHYGEAYKRERKALLASRPPCTYCGGRATEADHVPALALHAHRHGSGCCRLVPTCSDCARRQAPRVRDVARSVPLVEPDVELEDEPEGWAADNPVWDAAPWLDGFRDVPDVATWPRFMTLPHPDAVGTLGAEFCGYAEERSGFALRWWQRLVAFRLLEVDASGAFVWESLLLTLARQVGKSWWLRELCLWRLHQSERFGEPQDVVHTGKDLAICKEIQRPARVWAKARPTIYKVREVNGQEEIERLADGSRWMLRAKDAVYGYSASLAVVDEAWKVPAASVEEGLVPTMTERAGSQLVLVTTAHRRMTALVVKRRTQALTELAAPPGVADLFIEWSAPRHAPIDDVAGWRDASPWWTPRRERLIRRRLDAALSGESDDPDEPDPIESFRSQWLNQSPRRVVKPSKGEPLLAEGWPGPLSWDVPTLGPVVAVVEDWYGIGAAAAVVAETVDERWLVGGWAFDTRLEAFEWLRGVVEEHPGSTLVVGATLRDDPEFEDWPVIATVAAGTPDTRAGLSLLRELVTASRVVSDGSPDVADQINMSRVLAGTAGLTLVPGPRADLLRAVVWGLRTAVRQPVPMPDVMRTA